MLKIFVKILQTFFIINPELILESYAIIGGSYTIQKDWAFLVALVYESNKTLCSGSLIRTDWVLTSAHCVDPDCEVGKSMFKAVKLGVHETSDHGRYVPYEKYFLHPNYEFEKSGGIKRLIYDIALIKLEFSVSLSKRIRLVGLSELDLTGDVHFLSAGWGDTNLNNYKNTNINKKYFTENRPLLSIKQKNIEWKWCQSIVQSYFPKDNNRSASSHYCSYTYTLIGYAGLTNGDMGAPLIYDGEQYGIASYILFVPNISNYLYTVWQKLDLEWIDTKITDFSDKGFLFSKTFSSYTKEICEMYNNNSPEKIRRNARLYCAIFVWAVLYFIIILLKLYE